MAKVFLNDKLVDAEAATVSVTDAGFLYGAGLFETMRSYNGKVFSLDDHLERLLSSTKVLSIPTEYDKKYMTDAIYKTIKANELTNARLRLTLTSGSMSRSQDNPKSTLVIAATNVQKYPADYYKKGVLVILCPFRQNIFEITCGHKTTNYFSRMTALKLAHQKNAAEALWFTTDNRLAEGCISNVFLVKDSVLCTPHLSTPVLPGIARQTVCKLAEENSIELMERDLSIDDLLAADEIFLTNVIMQIMPVTKVEKHTVGKGDAGPVTKKLKQCYDDHVNNFCGQTK